MIRKVLTRVGCFIRQVDIGFSRDNSPQKLVHHYSLSVAIKKNATLPFEPRARRLGSAASAIGLCTAVPLGGAYILE